MKNILFISVLHLVLLVGCGGSGGSTPIDQTNTEEQSSTTIDAIESDTEDTETTTEEMNVDDTATLTLKESDFINKQMTLGTDGIEGYGYNEYVYYFYDNNYVEFKTIELAEGYPSIHRLQWEVENDRIYVNNGSRTTGTIYTSPQTIVFTEYPKKGQIVAFKSGNDSLFGSAVLEAFRDIDSRQIFTLNDDDFIDMTYQLDTGGDAGSRSTTIEFYSDKTASFISPGFHEIVTWEITDDKKILLSDFDTSKYYTREYEFRSKPMEAGDVVFVKIIDGIGQTAEITAGSTYLVTRVQNSTSSDTVLTENDLLGWTFQFNFSGSLSEYSSTYVTFHENGLADSTNRQVGSDYNITWEITGPKTVRLYGFEYNNPEYKEYIFTSIPIQAGDYVYRTYKFEGDAPSDSRTILVDKFKAE